jgi:hypothetical protein
MFYPSESMPLTNKTVHIHNPNYYGDAVYLVIYHSPTLDSATSTIKAVHKFVTANQARRPTDRYKEITIAHGDSLAIQYPYEVKYRLPDRLADGNTISSTTTLTP